MSNQQYYIPYYIPTTPQQQQYISPQYTESQKTNFLPTLLIVLQIFKYLIGITIICVIIYFFYWLYNWIKNAFTIFGTQSVVTGGVCSTHNDCKGWVPARAGTNGCCTSTGKSAGLGVQGKCTPLVPDAVGLGYCWGDVPLI